MDGLGRFKIVIALVSFHVSVILVQFQTDDLMDIPSGWECLRTSEAVLALVMACPMAGDIWFCAPFQ